MRVLFICYGNSIRSQIAEAFLRQSGKDAVEVHSAGTHPWFVSPLAIQVMKEVGVDISNYKSKSIGQFLDQQFDYVITLCNAVKMECPVLPNAKKNLHVYFEDPAQFFGSKEKTLDKFREVRDKIKGWIEEFLKNELAA